MEPMTPAQPQRSSPMPTCQFCGKILEPVDVLLGGQHFYVYPYLGCTCEENQKAVAAENEAAKAQALKEQQERRERTIIDSGISARYYNAVSPAAARLALKVKNGENVFITGSVGTGKTYLASAVLTALIDQGVRVRLISTVDLFGKIKAPFYEDDDLLFGYRDESVFYGDDDPFSKYQEVPVLVLDDFGRGSPPDFALERMFSLIDKRYGAMLPTIVTTQYMPSQLIRWLAKKSDVDIAVGIVNRLRQNSHIIRLCGSDRRLQKCSSKNHFKQI